MLRLKVVTSDFIDKHNKEILVKMEEHIECWDLEKTVTEADPYSKPPESSWKKMSESRHDESSEFQEADDDVYKISEVTGTKSTSIKIYRN